MIYNPTVILRCLSSQAVYFKINYGQMFYYSDLNQIWYDTQDNSRVLANDIVILQFERERNNYVPSNIYELYPIETPNGYLQDYTIVYVIETNSLYRYYHNSWTTIYGKYGQKSVAQTYLPDGTVKIIVPDDVTTNGILNDGSVVIRDNNKMICGVISSDGYTLNARGLIGGCINIDPSGTMVGDGCLQVTNSQTNLNSNLVIFGTLKIVDPSYWNKQYRLITEEISINTNTQIEAGSTIKANSILGDTTYSQDTILTESVNCTSGRITINSKIYINSIINNQPLQPPYLFDIPDNQYPYASMNMTVDNVTIDDTTLIVQTDITAFNNNGDCIFINTPSSISDMTKVQLGSSGISYDIEYISNSGIDETCKICYYSLNNKVKILP